MLAMAQTLSPDEKHLITELAVGIARRLSVILADFETGLPEREYFWHGAESPFEAGCEVLWRLGVARAAYGGDKPVKELDCRSDAQSVAEIRSFPPYFRFMEASEIRSQLAKNFPDKPPLLKEVLVAYVPLFCEYGPEDTAMSCDREPFYAPSQCAREVDALVRQGYMEQRGPEVHWTDKVGPVMQAAYLWQEDGLSRRTAHKTALEKECAAALAATSGFTKWRLRRAARRCSELDFATLLRDRFNGLYWTKNPDSTPRPGSSVALLKAVYRALRKRA